MDAFCRLCENPILNCLLLLLLNKAIHLYPFYLFLIRPDSLNRVLIISDALRRESKPRSLNCVSDIWTATCMFIEVYVIKVCLWLNALKKKPCSYFTFSDLLMTFKHCRSILKRAIIHCHECQVNVNAHNISYRPCKFVALIKIMFTSVQNWERA